MKVTQILLPFQQFTQIIILRDAVIHVSLNFRSYNHGIMNIKIFCRANSTV